jgi:HK97 family phage prohead protease
MATHATLQPLIEAARNAAEEAEERAGFVRRSFGITVRSINKDERYVDVVVSTDSLDAYGDVVDQDWDLKRYSKNPVVLWNHNRSFFAGPEADLPIGHADAVVRNGQLEARLFFVDERANPMAEKVFQGFVQKSISAVSAGFRPHTVSREMTDDVEFYRLSDNELYEISACPIPANPDAVAKAKALGQLKALAARSTTTKQVSTASSDAKKEPAMEIKELEDKIKSLEAAAAKSAEAMATTTKALEGAQATITELKASVTDLTGKLTASEKSHAETTTKLEAETKLRTDSEKTVTTMKVDALVGKKITPAERDEYVELALERPALFEKMMAKRADIPTAVGKAVVTAEKSATKDDRTAAADDGVGFEQLVPVAATRGFEDDGDDDDQEED